MRPTTDANGTQTRSRPAKAVAQYCMNDYHELMRYPFRLGSAVLAAILIPCAAQAAGSCSDLLKFSAADTTIEKAQDVAAGTVPAPPGAPPIPLHAPAHCRVDGIIGAHKGLDGKSYGIRFALAMPPNWNGRLLYQGGGGLNGSVQAPLGVTAARSE